MKTKKIIKFCLAFVILFNVCFDVTAYNLFDYELAGGVGNWGYNKRYYWVDPNAETITDLISNGYSSWIYTSAILSTPISWRRTFTKSEGTVEIHTYSSYDGCNGYADFFWYSTPVSPNYQNWGWCNIYYNTRYSGGVGTIAHEIGHTMGLDENNTNQYSVMCQASYGRLVNSPQYDDLAGINEKYN